MVRFYGGAVHLGMKRMHRILKTNRIGLLAAVGIVVAGLLALTWGRKMPAEGSASQPSPFAFHENDFTIGVGTAPVDIDVDLNDTGLRLPMEALNGYLQVDGHTGNDLEPSGYRFLYRYPDWQTRANVSDKYFDFPYNRPWGTRLTFSLGRPRPKGCWPSDPPQAFPCVTEERWQEYLDKLVRQRWRIDVPFGPLTDAVGFDQVPDLDPLGINLLLDDPPEPYHSQSSDSDIYGGTDAQGYPISMGCRRRFVLSGCTLLYAHRRFRVEVRFAVHYKQEWQKIRAGVNARIDQMIDSYGTPPAADRVLVTFPVNDEEYRQVQQAMADNHETYEQQRERDWQWLKTREE